MRFYRVFWNTLRAFVFLGLASQAWAEGVDRESSVLAKKQCDLLQSLVEQGDIHSLMSLASCYRDGLGRKKDIDLSVRYLERALDKGLAGAAQGLALTYAFHMEGTEEQLLIAQRFADLVGEDSTGYQDFTRALVVYATSPSDHRFLDLLIDSAIDRNPYASACLYVAASKASSEAQGVSTACMDQLFLQVADFCPGNHCEQLKSRNELVRRMASVLGSNFGLFCKNLPYDRVADGISGMKCGH